MPAFDKDSRVQWHIGRAVANGTVKEVYTTPVTRDDVRGNPKKRNASEDNPAYLVEREDDGSQFLKSESELSEAE